MIGELENENRANLMHGDPHLSSAGEEGDVSRRKSTQPLSFFAFVFDR
jgi:hypothetical protein